MAGPGSDDDVTDPDRAPSAAVSSHQQAQRVAPTLELLRSKASLVRTLAAAHKISTVSVIGSVATGKAHEDSDVDLLCDTEPGTTLYDIASCEIDLEQALGFPVCIITKASLNAAEDSALLANAVPVC